MAPRRYGKVSVSVTSSESQPADAHKTAEVGTTKSNDSDNFVSNRTSYDFTANSLRATQTDSPAKKRIKRSDAESSSEGPRSSNEAGSSVPTQFIGNFGVERARLDDLEYLFDGLDSKQPLSVRTTSMMDLAELCNDPETRKTLRAHSLIDKVFNALEDAEGNLALCGAVILYLLCRDTANAQLASTTSCRLLVHMLSKRAADLASNPAQASASHRPFSKKRDANQALASAAGNRPSESTQKRLAVLLPSDLFEVDHPQNGEGGAKAAGAQLDGKENIVAGTPTWSVTELTAENLAMSCCSQLIQQHTSFRDAFRLAEGVPLAATRLLDALLSLKLARQLGGAELTALRSLRRDLRFVEHLTFMSAPNQDLVMACGRLVPELIALVTRLSVLVHHAKPPASAPSGGGDADAAAATMDTLESNLRTVTGEVLLASLKVLVNLTNHNTTGAGQLAAAGGVPAALAMLHEALPPVAVAAAAPVVPGQSDSEQGAARPEDYDVLTLGLGLLINCVEESEVNKAELVKENVGGQPSLAFLVRLFLSRICEEDGDKLCLDKMRVDDLVVAAYTCVLLGCLMKDNEGNTGFVLKALGNRTVVPLVAVLDYFIACHQQADRGRTATPEFLDSLVQVLEVLGALL